MLRGVKPLAVFGDREHHFPDVVERYLRLFDRNVLLGRLTRFDRLQNIRAQFRVHSVYFTLPGEEWRVDAHVALYARPKPWNQAYERELGRLLGYSDWENDVWEDRFPYRSAEVLDRSGPR